MPNQSEDRKIYTDKIVDSKSIKKVIIAGPGTGKTFTFKQILNKLDTGNFLVLSFIRKLVYDLYIELGDKAEVKTFHAFCKKILHEKKGKIDIYSDLTNLIQHDSNYLGYQFSDFDNKFRNLEESSPEIPFYLKRADYYGYLSFDESVYRLYKLLKEEPALLNQFDQIIVDEYQDFNKLEVEFINELAKKSPILIAGDDDQAVYSFRSSSPSYIREIANSAEYEKFELPFCSRCPKVIVESVNSFITKAIINGNFKNRVNKQYIPFTEGRELLDSHYPKIKVIKVYLVKVIAKYILKEIQKIPLEEIQESNSKDSGYPTVLIIGPTHYLSETYKILSKSYPNINFDTKEDATQHPVIDAYKLLLMDRDSNLGWRILIQEFLDELNIKLILTKSKEETPLINSIPSEFKEKHNQILEIIRKVKTEQRIFTESESLVLKGTLKGLAGDIINYFNPTVEDKKDSAESNTNSVNILMKTFEGSKGLSGGHVFIIGAVNGSIPVNDNTITDIECSKFLVALTRTRKQCYIISNCYFSAPVNKKKQKIPKLRSSTFIDWIPTELKQDYGLMSAKQF